MTSRILPISLGACVAAWAALCVACYISSSNISFEFSYFVLPASSIVIPPVIAALAINTYGSRASSNIIAPKLLIGTVASYTLAALAYLSSWLGLARLLEIPWRKAKFGEPLDLGFSAFTTYIAAIGLVLLASILLFRSSPPNSRQAKAAIASIGMLTFVAGLFILVASTPLVQWRR